MPGPIDRLIENSSLTKPNLFLFVLIALGLLGGLVSAAHRWKAEARNRRVELVVDYGDAQALANTTRRQVDDVLQQLRERRASRRSPSPKTRWGR